MQRNSIMVAGFAGALGLVAATAWSAAPAAHKPATEVAALSCVDSAGPTTAFFCTPKSAKGQPISACTAPSEASGCEAGTARAFCSGKGYTSALSYGVSSSGHLSEVVCRSPTPVAVQVAAWQPMFDANLLGYDRREFIMKRGEDWKRCKAACEADGGCQAWTVSRENNTCYLKWDGNPELVSYNACCVTGLKGMESGGPSAARARLRETGGS